MNETDQSAILVFSRSASEEAKAKKFTRHFGTKDSFLLAHNLINYTLTQAKESNLLVYSCSTIEQHGDSFGERLANGIEAVFNKGYINVIVVGGDSPSVTSAVLNEADSRLKSHDLVVGPAKDGGVYFIGISKEGYLRDKFLSVPWCTDQVFNAFKTYASALNISMFAASSGEDIDDAVSFQQWLKSSPLHELSISLKNILPATKKISFAEQALIFLQKPYLSISALRGPPRYTSIFR